MEVVREILRLLECLELIKQVDAYYDTGRGYRNRRSVMAYKLNKDSENLGVLQNEIIN